MEFWINKLNETFIQTGYYKMMLQGFGNTMVITTGALIIGIVIGVLISVTKYFAEDTPALKPFFPTAILLSSYDFLCKCQITFRT